jgi:hypothetical protein
MDLSEVIKLRIENIETHNEMLIIRGWAFSKFSDNFLEIEVDNTDCKIERDQYIRNDVYQLFSE